MNLIDLVRFYIEYDIDFNTEIYLQSSVEKNRVIDIHSPEITQTSLTKKPIVVISSDESI